jgi:hypothetical protein
VDAPAGDDEHDATLVVDVAASQASAINRTLGAAGLYPAELTIRRQSLETVFRELTSDHDAAPAPPDDGAAIGGSTAPNTAPAATAAPPATATSEAERLVGTR